MCGVKHYGFLVVYTVKMPALLVRTYKASVSGEHTNVFIHVARELNRAAAEKLRMLDLI